MSSTWLKAISSTGIRLSRRLLRPYLAFFHQDRPMHADFALKIWNPYFKSFILKSISIQWGFHQQQTRNIYLFQHQYGMDISVNLNSLEGKISSQHPMTISGNHSALTLSNRISLNYTQKRFKSTQKHEGTDDTVSDSDEDDCVLENDDFDAPAKYRVMKIQIPSLRADAVISHALNIARNRLEEEFLSSGFLLNGSKMLKKSVKMEEGDFADLVVEKMDDQLKVKRVKVIKVYPDKTSKDKAIVKVRVWKAPFLIANPVKFHRDP